MYVSVMLPKNNGKTFCNALPVKYHVILCNVEKNPEKIPQKVQKEIPSARTLSLSPTITKFLVRPFFCLHIMEFYPYNKEKTLTKQPRLIVL